MVRKTKRKTTTSPKYDVVISTTVKGVSKQRADELEREAKGSLANSRVYKKRR